MPQRFCPNCQAQTDWGMDALACSRCGYLSDVCLTAPSDYQAEKIRKHFDSSYVGNENNWKFYSKEGSNALDLFHATMAAGSTVASGMHVLSFERNIGYNEKDPSQVSAWVAVVIANDPEKSHMFPLKPSLFANSTFRCMKCGKEYTGRCPEKCESCGSVLFDQFPKQ